ncbi:MCP four helix bundle domain-containing protein [uncultured Acetobacteroides sp.]|uniref:MCP four helix bundle domain-containing protein n=1 Tax=uncultured Acetobacteroides sp. TaxID=1760811 RepID=UPI0029F5B911|nr:MCP four helix bundle domain-containing protein [uncultured Acetobacteroides sp.]
MGIKSKMLAGFVVIGLLLFLSGAITLFEVNSMGNSVQGMLNDNLRSIEVSKQMVGALNQINQGVLLAINGKSEGAIKAIDDGEKLFERSYSAALNNLTIEGEEHYVKAIDSSYRMFKMQVDSAVLSSNAKNIDWYFAVLMPNQNQLIRAVDSLMAVNQKAIYQNVKQMKTGANRAMMPGLIAIGVGIVFVFLFNYFVNIFFVTPITRISQGVENYVKHAIPFRVKVDTKDELERLKNSVEKLIIQNKSNKIED